jgi:hypothetical protein
MTAYEGSAKFHLLPDKNSILLWIKKKKVKCEDTHVTGRGGPIGF